MKASSTKASLRSASDAIRKLLRGSEAEFLAVVGKLSDLADQAGHIAEGAQAALREAGSAAGPEIEARLAEDVEVIQRAMSGDGAAVQEGQRELVALGESLDELDLLSGEFRRLVLILRSLASLTRMEGSRTGLEGSGFLTVSDDVAALAKVIHDRFRALRHRSAPLHSLVDQASSQRHDGGGEALDLLGGVLRSASRLLDVNRESQERLERVDVVMSELGAAIGQVIVDLQFHDMTRQQLEHVIEALDEEEARLSGDVVDREELAKAGELAELLVGQVLHARDEIRASVEGLLTNLYALGERVRDVAGELSAVSSSSSIVLRALESQLGEALRALRDCTARTHDVVGVAANIATIVDELSGFIKEIGGIGDQIHLIAFNAIVRSARTGERGRAVGALADEIQAVASATQRQTAAAAAVLATVSQQASALHANARILATGGAPRAVEVAEDLSALLGRLGAADAAVLGGSSEVAAQSREIQAAVEQLTQRIRYHIVAGHVLGQVAERLRVVATEAALPGDARLAGRAQRLAAHQRRYTMASERRIHQAALQGSAASAPVGGVDHDLGGNVELF